MTSSDEWIISRSIPWQLLRISLKRKLVYAFVPFFFSFPSFCCSKCGWDGLIRSSHLGPYGGHAFWKKIKWIWFPEDFFSPAHRTNPETSCFSLETSENTCSHLSSSSKARKRSPISFSSFPYSQACWTVCCSWFYHTLPCFCALPLLCFMFYLFGQISC